MIRPPKLTPEERRNRLATMEALFLQGNSYKDIGEMYSLSRERVRQIFTSTTNPDVIRINKRRHKETSDLKSCSVCRRRFSKKVRYASSGVCRGCTHYQKNGGSGQYLRRLLISRLKSCLSCRQPFTPEKPYSCRLRHKICYARYRYKTDEAYRRRLNGYSLKWYLRTKDDPRLKEQRKLYAREYARRPEVAKKRKLYFMTRQQDPEYAEQRRLYQRERYRKMKLTP